MRLAGRLTEITVVATRQACNLTCQYRGFEWNISVGIVEECESRVAMCIGSVDQNHRGDVKGLPSGMIAGFFMSDFLKSKLYRLLRSFFIHFFLVATFVIGLFNVYILCF